MEKFEEPRVIGRTAELDKIRSFFRSHMDARTGGGLYVCGRSGTGKTEAIRQVVDGIRKSLDAGGDTGKARNKKQRSGFRVAWLNGNSINGSASLYSSLARELSIPATDSKAEVTVESRLSRSADDRDDMFILVLDEIDLLSEDTVRKLFSWSNEKSSLILIGIANVVNAGVNLFRSELHPPEELAFPPYDAAQLKAIVTKKIGDVAERFSPEALDMCARKVSVKSGDVRQCLSLCEEALALAKDRPKVSLGDVVRAANASQSPISKTISALPAQCKFALVACTSAAMAVATKAAPAVSPTSVATGNGKETGTSQPDKYNEAFDLKSIRDCWLKLREIWKIPIEGELDDHLQGLYHSKILESATPSAAAKKAKGGSASTKQQKGMADLNKWFKLLPTRDEIQNGLIGGGDSDEDEGNGPGTADMDLVMRRPIMMAFNNIRHRTYANMHAPLT